MNTISATQARSQLYQLIKGVNDSSYPIKLTRSKEKGAILIGEDDWRSIEETLYLCSIPGMRESIQEGLKTPIEDCVSELPW